MTNDWRRLTAAAAIGFCLLPSGCEQSLSPNEPAPQAIPITTDCSIPAVPDVSSVRFNLDVPVYAPQGTMQLLDIARPLDPGPHPLVVMVHGGGWREGHQHEFVDEIAQLASLGYVAASVSYRLAPTFTFPAQMSDIRCAIRFLRAKSDSLGIDPGRVVLVGASAGGHLAALTAFAPEASQFDSGCPYQGQSVAVSGVVSYYGVLDLQQPSDFPSPILEAIEQFLGAPAGSAVAATASPVAYADAGDPPVLIIHGTADDVIAVAQARRVHAALGSIGLPSTLVELPGVEHGFPVLATAQPMRTASCTTLAFLDRYLRP